MGAQLSLASVEFANGRRPGAPRTRVDPVGSIVVIVGPNNSGKSSVLREIRDWTIGQETRGPLIHSLSARVPETAEDVKSLLEPFERPTRPGDIPGRLLYQVSSPPEPTHGGIAGPRDYDLDFFERLISTRDENVLRNVLLGPLSLRLDGQSRFALSTDQPLGDLQGAPDNHISRLFRDDASRSRLRQMVHEAFGRFLVIEPTGAGMLRLRLSDRPPASPEEEQGLTQRAVQFHAAAALLEGQGDGIRAFVGLATAVMSLPHRLLLVDEPEAFLHPPLARRLGRELATLISEREGTLVVGTHSAAFLAGCVDSGKDLTVVRLTYDGHDRGTARVLAAPDVRRLMIEPLIRSSGVLNGVFHRAVVVVEGDTDRVFYDEINDRLDEAGRGIRDAIFVNAHSWQTVGVIAGALRQAGVPAAGILDLDAVVKGGEWGPLWRAMNLSPDDRQTITQLRQECEHLLRATERGDRKPYKDRGLVVLRGEARAKLRKLVDELARRGVFLVPVGSLESWLPALGVRGKRSWVQRIFEAMGSDPARADYLRPGRGGPWAFLDGIEAWVQDEAREGMG